MPILNIFPRVVYLSAWNVIRLLQRPFGDFVRLFCLLETVHGHSLLPAGGFARWLSIARGLAFVVMADALRHGGTHISQHEPRANSQEGKERVSERAVTACSKAIDNVSADARRSAVEQRVGCIPAVYENIDTGSMNRKP